MRKAFNTINAAFMAAGILLGSAAHANLVTNGGFESGDFAGWQLTGSSEMNLVGADPDYVHSGSNAAFFGEVGDLGGIVQQLTTTAGQEYSLKFWLGNMGGNESNSDTVSFFALAIGGIQQPASLLDNKTASAMMSYDVSFTATSALTELAFSFRQDENFWFLDDVSVDLLPDDPAAPAPVPEPGTVPLLLVAAAGWLLTRAKRRAPWRSVK